MLCKGSDGFSFEIVRFDGLWRGRSQAGKDRGQHEEEEGEPEAITNDRKTIGTNPYARTHWALGLLSLDEDIAKIDLGKKG